MASSPPGFPRVGQGAHLGCPPPSAPVLSFNYEQYITSQSADSQPSKGRLSIAENIGLEFVDPLQRVGSVGIAFNVTLLYAGVWNAEKEGCSS
jgi:hypothetical protein